jgi:long-chain fatty acid transport protein
MNHTLLRRGTLAAALLSPFLAHATNGYFSNGYGEKSQGIAGIGIALPQDALAAASNPAGTAFVGDRVDLGLSWFSPKRNAKITGNGYGANGSYDGNGTKDFLIPDFGYVTQLSKSLSAGIAVYGNGGMNTDYSRNPFAAFGSTGSAGINLEQLFVSPSLAWKANEQNALGAALNFAYQRFEAKGLNAFGTASANSGSLTNRGTDTSTGWGLRLGWTGQIAPALTLGATWSSKINASKFEKYKGLFADGGSFDIPENYGVGVAYKATQALTLAAEVEEIKYSGVRSVNNPLANLTVLGHPLGSTNGGGFGWKDVAVTRLGASYEYSPDLTLRAGYSHGDNPVPADQTFFNILAPGVVQDHVTVGGTWKTGPGGELTLSYAHALKKTVNGSGSIPASFGGGEANVSLEENVFGVSYGWKL